MRVTRLTNEVDAYFLNEDNYVQTWFNLEDKGK